MAVTYREAPVGERGADQGREDDLGGRAGVLGLPAPVAPDTVRGMYVLAKAALVAKLGGTTKSSSHGCKTGTGAFLI